MSSLLEICELQCNYDHLVVIKDFTLNLPKGEIACLLGPSGCGKSTVLRAIAGFEEVAAGEIKLAGETVSAPDFLLPPEKRHVGMVFQDYALFPHLTVFENIRFGLQKRKQKDADRIIGKLIELVDLQGYQERYPHELSGGQQQRVALARALAPEPQLLLLDEPFSNLDAELRARLSLDVRSILKDLGITAILVTHDQQEAFAMSDHIGVVDSGKIQQWGSPFELYHEPANRFVACFIGKGSFVPGKVLTPDSFSTELGVLRGNRAYNWPEQSPVEILLRPDDIICDHQSPLNGKVLSKTFAGTNTQYLLELASGLRVEASFPSHEDFYVGNTVNFAIDAEHLIAYPVAELP